MVYNYECIMYIYVITIYTLFANMFMHIILHIFNIISIIKDILDVNWTTSFICERFMFGLAPRPYCCCACLNLIFYKICK